ncbi:MAG TPA: gluconate 2-dehydrogenase subunit 3 family protein [Polyangia bacterium]
MSERIHWIVDGAGQPMPPREQPGYYPGFSTLGQRAFWDEATRRTVLKRVEEVPPLRFFGPDEARLLEAVVARVLPQGDRTPERQIPIVPFIDERLHEGRQDGYRYENMPPDGEAHRLGLRAIDAGAQARFGRRFIDLDPREKDTILGAIHDGKPVGGDEIWSRMSVHRYWLLLMTDVCHVYYAHPWAWDEIGFGGPAYPRGYMRLENGEPEPWEVPEQRYEWSAPSSADSSRYELVAGLEDHYGSGQGGTH